jgi:hypothetical protein
MSNFVEIHNYEPKGYGYFLKSISSSFFREYDFLYIFCQMSMEKVKVKQSLYRSGVAQRVTGS